MANKDFEVTCEDAYVQPETYKQVRVTLKEVDTNNILGEFDLDEIIEYFGKADILDHIGETNCMDHFSND